MSFGESIFFTGFIQKTIKVDLHVKFNCAYPQQNGQQKSPHRSGPVPPVSRLAPRAHLLAPHCYVGSPPPLRLHLHRPLSRFDPRAHYGRSGLYKQPYTPLPEASLKP